eukprot:CAMPEP_0113326550 /NCGR_PEP_ID=MMETSP0010_2-20120614/18598_1 /TAXON_ID=216773 ORGANISM="Corethron hystrix, Strain 308" /NCGR_SAMPLE_ID=MMETSP0010_2 /ASSEMBLY_ACC=CAM_ASM_000155 /LENGTH=249 /DNA_ID=CAMNT_0000186923 /DNA_START=799 /DNA_END=1546 /DNA_ORIENTATION=+ /assembly_acc=CAM_ASM_000155
MTSTNTHATPHHTFLYHHTLILQQIVLSSNSIYVFILPSPFASTDHTTPLIVIRHFDRVSKQLRAEFARGDGRVKRKEDIRRANIRPSETLFVVNFNERTTKREDLEMLFSNYGTIIRIDMKRNYAFVQFSSVHESKQAKEATDGGKLDEAIITVEYVARKIPPRDGPRRDYQRDAGYHHRRQHDNYRSDYRSPREGRDYDRRLGGRDRFDGRYDDYSVGRSGGRGAYKSRSNSPSGLRARGRSRSRSP